MEESSSKGRIDWYILLPVVGLMLFSLAFVYSASATRAQMKFGSSEYFFLKHLARIIVGLVVIIIFAKIDYHKWVKYSKIALIGSMLLLFYVLLTGQAIHGASRWINLGIINFQPSELAKFTLILHLSTLLAQKQEKIKDFKEGLLPLLFWSLSVCFLIGLQPNFSSALVIFLISLSLMFVGNANLFQLGTIALFCLVGGLGYALTAEYRLQRILSYLGLAKGDEGVVINYQLKQALIALGTGGFFGLGPGQSRQSNLFLPESFGDFIFAIIGEEYGWLGSIAILLAFGFIFWRGMLIAKKATDDLGYFLAFGIIITFSIYVFVNAGVNCGILPTTGLPMPFISYGGTAVLFYAAAIGVLLNISAQAGVYPKSKK
ncbi:MAG: putative peptidoglycan glycosyltransferase FtsW [Candidatus Kapabacteria bacterium]|nr:putative peptidoglycan glycosyltransferase FtsW [Candidatus Kapabacteria bacterium]